MAQITQFTSPKMTSGSAWHIYYQFIFFFRVGDGVTQAADAFELDFKGDIDTAFYKGPFSIDLKLLDGNPGADAGPAGLILNGSSARDASYRVSSGQLGIQATLQDGSSQWINIYRGNDDQETFIGLSGHVGGMIHLSQT